MIRYNPRYANPHQAVEELTTGPGHVTWADFEAAVRATADENPSGVQRGTPSYFDGPTPNCLLGHAMAKLHLRPTGSFNVDKVLAPGWEDNVGLPDPWHEPHRFHAEWVEWVQELQDQHVAWPRAVEMADRRRAYNL